MIRGQRLVRFAFDGDAVIFSDESEKIYQESGLEAFADYEKTNARKPLPEGPFSKLLHTISILQESFPREAVPIRTALVTARNAPALRLASCTLTPSIVESGLAK